MTGSRRAVKGRRYDTTLRRERAQESRERIITAAERRFLGDGYVATTVTAIATDAGISVDTIYKSFGGKPGLVRAVYRRALEGEGPVPAEARSDQLQEQEVDPGLIIQGWGRFVSEIAPRGAPIYLLVRTAAANDPELEALLREIDDDRLQRMTDNARRLHAAGHLRRGVTVASAADVLWTYSSPELYDLLVQRRHMSPAAYGQFVADAMVAALL